MKNFYDILKVSRNANNTEIKKAYLNELKKYHPDVTEFDKTYAEERTKEITEAYKILSNKDTRVAYDKLLEDFENITTNTNSNNSNGYYSNPPPNDYGSQNNANKENGNNESKEDTTVKDQQQYYQTENQNNRSNNAESKGFKEFVWCYIIIFFVYSFYLFSAIEPVSISTNDSPAYSQQPKQENQYVYQEKSKPQSKPVVKESKTQSKSVAKESKTQIKSVVEKEAKLTTSHLENDNPKVIVKLKKSSDNAKYKKYEELRIGKFYAGMLIYNEYDLVSLLGDVKRVNRNTPTDQCYQVEYEYGTATINTKTNRLCQFETREIYDLKNNTLATDRGATVYNFVKGGIRVLYGKPEKKERLYKNDIFIYDVGNLGTYRFYFVKDTVAMIRFSCPVLMNE